ncbi:MAG: DNA translocase FtsK 4TM domain-containing protein, partial [Rhodothermales bacterium]
MSKGSKRKTSGGGAKATAAARNKKKAAPASPAPSRERQFEILGLIVMMLAVLLVLGLASYNPSDDPLAADFRLANVLKPGAPPASNILGLVGA